MTTLSQHPVARLAGKSSLRILGINSGTSLDALDLCCVRISERTNTPLRVRPLDAMTIRFPARLRQRLWHLAGKDSVSKAEVSRAHMEFGSWAGHCVRRFRDRSEFSLRPDAIAFHGQTIGHFPRSTRPQSAGVWRGDATWQIGAAAAVAQQTGVITISDFRTADVAAGGMGAPLSGYYHTLLFGEEHAVLNLGGIANISVAHRRRGRLEVLAFDIGPGNMILDALAQRLAGRAYDRNGALAAKGRPIDHVLRRAKRHPYFKKRPPKTCGREEFGEAVLRIWLGNKSITGETVPDLMATAVRITSDQIAHAIPRWVEPFSTVRSMLWCGGGVYNKTLVNTIRSQLASWHIADTSTVGFDPQYVEPAGFALLANETIRGRAGNCGGATGGQPAILGSISIPLT